MFKTDNGVDKELEVLANEQEYWFTTSKLDGIAQVKNVTAVVVRWYAPNIPSPQVWWMWVDTSTNKVYVAYWTTSVSEWALMGSSSVPSVFGRTWAVVAVSGDYDADKITETANRVFVTPTMKAYSAISTGTAAPWTTPSAVWQTYVDTTNKKIYVATGTTNSSDRTILN